MKLIVTGSIAFDYLMSFPGKFTEHFLPEHMHRVSLSFLVDTMDKRRGGCAPNIAYTLALLGERPYLMATAGQDFGDYQRWLDAAGVRGAFLVICNDYEFELIRQKTGMGEQEILAHAPVLVVTKGEKGCSIHTAQGVTEVAAVVPHRIEDPTGVGDAFRGGFMKGLAMGAPYLVCGQLGSVAATYALEHLGGTSHAYTWAEFKERYALHFGTLNFI